MFWNPLWAENLSTLGCQYPPFRSPLPLGLFDLLLLPYTANWCFHNEFLGWLPFMKHWWPLLDALMLWHFFRLLLVLVWHWGANKCILYMEPMGTKFRVMAILCVSPLSSIMPRKMWIGLKSLVTHFCRLCFFFFFRFSCAVLCLYIGFILSNMGDNVIFILLSGAIDKLMWFLSNSRLS